MPSATQHAKHCDQMQDAREELLEVMMPLEDAPEGDEVAASIQGDTPLNENQ